jgi:hypothetical protein
MPEEKNAKTVDIDTSGPEVDVELKDETPTKESSEVEIEAKEETVKEVKAEEKTAEVKAEEKKDESPKKELEEYSEGVQKRIAKLTRKMREAERQREEAVKYAKAIQAKQEVLERKLTSVEAVNTTEMEGRIKSGLQAAQAKLQRAREDSNYELEVQAQKEIAQLALDESKLKDMRSRQQETVISVAAEKAREQFAQPMQNISRPDPKAEDWASKNEWFGKDKAMTYTAFDLHSKLVDEEGFDPQSDEYYTEIDKRIRLEFPNKFVTSNTTESTKPTQTVASAKRNVKTGRKTVRLTPSQVAIAKKLGVPLEEYAKQLNITKEV